MAALFAALIVFENSGVARYNFAVSDHAARISRIQSELRGKECAEFFVAGTEDTYKTHMDAMWASLESRIPTINGYSGNTPPKWPFEYLRDVRLAQLRAWLRRHRANSDHLCTFRH